MARVAPLVPTTPRLAAVLCLLVALATGVLALGLPRMLVRCRHGDHSHLTMALAADCCEHQGQGERSPGEGSPGERDGDTPQLTEPGCQHSGLGIDMAPPPRLAALTTIAAPPRGLASPWTPAGAQPPRRALPPATGPPRPDPRTERQATTRLLL